MTTPYQQITAHRFLWQMGAGAALGLSWILIPTITANLHGITRQTHSSPDTPPPQPPETIGIIPVKELRKKKNTSSPRDAFRCRMWERLQTRQEPPPPSKKKVFSWETEEFQTTRYFIHFEGFLCARVHLIISFEKIFISYISVTDSRPAV